MKLKILVCLSLITLVALFAPAAHGQTFSVIHTLTGPRDGRDPYAGVTYKAGALYGTTYDEGGGGNGTVYQITQSASNWITTPISIFSSGGSGPDARVVFGPDGHLYGTTQMGGDYDCGIVFKLTPPLSLCKTANCFWKEDVLYNFKCTPDGANPAYGDLVWDQAGNIYGTTAGGGPSNEGTVYELKLLEDGWTEQVINGFSGSEGEYPVSGVISDNNGNLFGTALEGGLYGYGTIFELSYSAENGWTENVLYNFQFGNDGGYPYGGLYLDKDSSNFYGTTSSGGANGGGTVFELAPSGDTWTFKLLFSLSGDQTQKYGPRGNLTMDAAGNLYGTTFVGGSFSQGSVFKLTQTGNTWSYSALHNFTGGDDGLLPAGNVTFDTSGNLYGTALGGAQNAGVVWMITPQQE